VANEAGVGRLVLSHFYPVTERYNVREQAGEAFGGKIIVGEDLMAIKL
jgi:ribonuclease BN (tRNA processing enzyme)